MPCPSLLITEIFHSLQGESSLAGKPFAFIRLTGCNLRCAYCDSTYAFKGGTLMPISAILDEIRPYSTRNVLLTGGEPLLQRPVPTLLDALLSEGYDVSIETHGEVSIEKVADRARIIMDIKTPSSGMCRGGFRKNLQWLKPADEIKFVIASQEDYFWARETLRAEPLPCHEILFSPVIASKGAPGRVSGVDPKWLAERVLEDRLPVRMQLQLHKLIWGPDRHGV